MNTVSPIDIRLDGKANDGQPDERDDVAADFENIVGSQYGGTLTGTAGANEITGGGDDDRLAGGAGRDSLSSGGGNDTIDALDGAPGDRVDCSVGANVAYLDAGDLQAEEACERIVRAPGLATAKLRYAAGRVRATLACPRGGAYRGTLRLTSTKGKRLGQATYRIGAGKRARLQVTRRVPAEAPSGAGWRRPSRWWCREGSESRRAGP